MADSSDWQNDATAEATCTVTPAAPSSWPGWGATRGGSPGIFGYTGGQAASGSPAAVSRSCIARSGSSHVSGDGFWFDLTHRLAAASKDFGVSGRATGVAERDASIEPTVLRSRDAAIEQRVRDGPWPGP